MYVTLIVLNVAYTHGKLYAMLATLPLSGRGVFSTPTKALGLIFSKIRIKINKEPSL